MIYIFWIALALIACVLIDMITRFILDKTHCDAGKARLINLIVDSSLFALVAAMLVFCYFYWIENWELTPVLIQCILEFLEYIGYGIVILVAIKLIPKLFHKEVPNFIFRKLLHLVAFSSIIEMMIASGDSWISACICSLIFALIIYPLIRMLENYGWFNRLLLPKHPGETAISLLLLFVPIAMLITLMWGVFGKEDLAMCAVLMWGVGDAAAALIGIPFGKHKISWKITDGKKSYEGTIAAFFFSFIVGVLLLILRGTYSIGICFVFALVTAPVVAFVELISRRGTDTFTVPLAAGTVLILLSLIFG